MIPAIQARSGSDAVGAAVVNFNSGRKILECLRALRAQTLALEEIVVVDNGSSDGSLDRVRRELPEVRIVELGANRGLPTARNIGLRELGTRLALSVDSDVYLAPDCLEKLTDAYAKSGAGIVCPRILLHPEESVVQCDGASLHFVGTLALRHAFRPVDELPELGSIVGGCVGACLLFDRERVLAAGGFDELYFFYFEDLEFSFRLRARGERLFCEPLAVVRHERGEGVPGLSFRGSEAYPTRRAYLTMRHRWLTILIHYRLRTLLLLAPALATYELATFTVSLRRGWLAAWARSWWWLLRHRREVRERRTRAQAARSVSDRELLEGGLIPLAPGFIRSRVARTLVGALSASLSLYWSVARRWIG